MSIKGFRYLVIRRPDGSIVHIGDPNISETRIEAIIEKDLEKCNQKGFYDVMTIGVAEAVERGLITNKDSK